jgi:hypothetical protein
MASTSEPLGHPDRPASDDDLRAKWVRLTGASGDEPFDRLSSADEGESFANVLRGVIGNRLQ